MTGRDMHGREEALTKAAYGGRANREWRRLTKDAYHRLEFETTLLFLHKYLPRNGSILDAGGGPGRYTISLAKKGYDVTLFDLTPQNLSIARREIRKEGLENKVKNIEEGSITDLSRFKTNSFDAVLCLGGPLSHVGTPAKRRKAISELIRVARSGAPIFVSVMGKLAVLQLVTRQAQREMKMGRHYARLVTRGDDYMFGSGNSGNRPLGYCHYFTLEEMRNLFRGYRAAFVESVGLEGISSHREREINEMYLRDKKAWKSWLNTHHETCTNPSVVDTSSHMLVIYRKQ